MAEKTKQVKEHTRRLKNGKIVKVRAHSARYKSAEEEAVEAKKKEGAGKEFEARGAALKARRERQNANMKTLNDAAGNPKWAKMRYRDAVKAGAPKLSPYYGEHISKRMNYGTALKYGYPTVKGIKKRVKKAKENNEK